MGQHYRTDGLLKPHGLSVLYNCGNSSILFNKWMLNAYTKGRYKLYMIIPMRLMYI